jgi:hypothetical protein
VHRTLTERKRAQAAAARALPSSLASVNQGLVAATPRPGIFRGQAVRAPRYSNSVSAPSSHPTLNGWNRTRNTVLRSAAVNPHSQTLTVRQDRPSLVDVQQHPSAPAAQRGEFGPTIIRTPIAQSRMQVAPWSPPQSYRPAQRYRVSPSFVRGVFNSMIPVE